jgi:hypothetical protein
MGLGNFIRSLTPGNDHQLAATQYAGRESATDSAARKERARRSRAADKADRKGNAWADNQRRRYG